MSIFVETKNKNTMKNLRLEKEWFNDEWHFFIYEDNRPIKAFFTQDEAEAFLEAYLDRLKGPYVLREVEIYSKTS